MVHTETTATAPPHSFASRFRPYFMSAAAFSLLLNLLLLAPALFMLQVFDRVLTSRSIETLVMLLVLAVGALLFMAYLDVIRSRLLTAAAVALEKLLGPRVLSEMLRRNAAPGAGEALHGLRDVNSLRAFLTGPGILALFDAPWVPLYVLVIFLFHPLLGAVALAGALVMLALAIGIWVALAPLSGAVLGPGFVKVDMNRKTVQHQEGGLVGEILVRDGSKVEAGQTLLVLKDVRVDAGNDAARTQLDVELAKAARLSAEQTGAGVVSFPTELTVRGSDPRVAELLRHENSVFRVRREALANQIALIRNQVGEARDEITARGAQMKADDEATRFQREELAQNRLLAEQGFVSKTRLLSLQREAALHESRRAEGAAELAFAKQKVSDLELRAETLRSAFKQGASNELRQTTATIFELRERLRPALDAEQRQRITAPIAGEVVDLKVTTVGAVIAPRDPILDIVPDNPVLIVEARVRPEDISFVRAGALADVRLTAFRQRITPTVEGKVSYISADRLVDKTNNTPYYLVHVLVPAEALRKAGNLKLQAGMPAEVFIRTTSRNALEYLLDPILGFLQRSLREQ